MVFGYIVQIKLTKVKSRDIMIQISENILLLEKIEGKLKDEQPIPTPK